MNGCLQQLCLHRPVPSCISVGGLSAVQADREGSIISSLPSLSTSVLNGHQFEMTPNTKGAQLKLSAENRDGKPCQKLWTEGRSQTAGQRTGNNQRLRYDFILSEGLRNDLIWAIFAKVCFISPNHFAICNQVLCSLHLYFNLKTKGFPKNFKWNLPQQPKCWF